MDYLVKLISLLLLLAACSKKPCDEHKELQDMISNLEYLKIQCTNAGFPKSKCHRLEIERSHELMTKFLQNCPANN